MKYGISGHMNVINPDVLNENDMQKLNVCYNIRILISEIFTNSIVQELFIKLTYWLFRISNRVQYPFLFAIELRGITIFPWDSGKA